MKKVILCLIPALLLSGCAPAEVNEESTTYELAPSVRKADSTKTEGYSLTFTLKDNCFDKKATVFNKELAMVSFGNSLATSSESTMTKFYEDLKFDTLESHFVAERTEESVCYMFAHRNFGKYDVVSLSVSGFDYEIEWVNNVQVGESGNHEGFEARANEVYAALKTYLTQFEKPKLWISGYSRAGAISNIVSHFVLSKNEINIKKEDMYVYTFEAPKALDINNRVNYSNVFNLVSSGDFVTYVPPEEYGFSRYGVDVDIYTDKANELIAAFDEDIEVAEFKECDGLSQTASGPLTSPAEFFQDAITVITRDGGDDTTGVYIHTRHDFASQVQAPIQTAIRVYFSLSDSTKAELLEAVKAKAADYSILNLLNSTDDLYDFITPFLDEDGYQYDEDTLRNELDILRRFIGMQFSLIASVFMGYDYGNNFKRGITMHYPEINYVL